MDPIKLSESVRDLSARLDAANAAASARFALLLRAAEMLREASALLCETNQRPDMTVQIAHCSDCGTFIGDSVPHGDSCRVVPVSLKIAALLREIDGAAGT